jgi:LacI family transcriptional regulator
MHLFIRTDSKPLAVLDAHGEDYHIKQRRNGFISYAEEHNLSVVVQEYSGLRGTDLLLPEVESFLSKQKYLSGIFVTNAMAHRVAEAEHNREKVPLIGYDLLPDNRHFLADGAITALISQQPYEQGRLAMLNIYRSVVLEQTITPQVDIPINIYIKENLPPDIV